MAYNAVPMLGNSVTLGSIAELEDTSINLVLCSLLNSHYIMITPCLPWNYFYPLVHLIISDVRCQCTTCYLLLKFIYTTTELSIPADIIKRLYVQNDLMQTEILLSVYISKNSDKYLDYLPSNARNVLEVDYNFLQQIFSHRYRKLTKISIKKMKANAADKIYGWHPF